jgi:hypothetical protein
VRDKAKANWKRETAIKLKTEIQAWVRRLKESWQKEDQGEHLERYVNMQGDFERWLVSDEADKALTALKDLERW